MQNIRLSKFSACINLYGWLVVSGANMCSANIFINIKKRIESIFNRQHLVGYIFSEKNSIHTNALVIILYLRSLVNNSA